MYFAHSGGCITISGSHLTPSGGRFALSDGRFAPSDGRFAPSGGRVAPSGGHFAPSGDRFSPSGGHFVPSGSSFMPSSARFTPSGVSFMPFGNSFALCIFSSLIYSLFTTFDGCFALVAISHDLATHSRMRWNLTSKKFPTETEYGVWKLILCSFTYQSQKNLFS